MLRPITVLLGVCLVALTLAIILTLRLAPALNHGDLLATVGWRVTMTDTTYRFTITDLERSLNLAREYAIGSNGGLVFAPTGERVMIPHGDGVSLLDLQSGLMSRTPPTSLPRLNNSMWATDGQTFMLVAGEQALSATDPLPRAEITLIDAETGTTRNLSEGVLNAVLSPSGAYVLTTQDDGLYVVDLNTDETWQAQALPDGGRYLNFIWSVEGDRLAVVRSLNMETDLFVLDVESREMRNLTADITERPVIVNWSPNGEQIALTAGLMSERVLYMIDFESGATEHIATADQNGLDQLWGVIWRPDSQSYVIQTGAIGWVDTGQPTARLYWRDSDGTLTQITDYGDGAQWSADGRYILYRTSRPSPRLGVFDTRTGTASHQQTRTGIGFIQPQWTSDSRHVIFNDLNRLYQWDIVTNTVTEITPNPFGVIIYALYE